MNSYHTSVLLSEAIENLKVRKGEKYIDATLGGGGHSAEIVKRGGIVLGIDVDRDALNHVASSHRLFLEKGNFRDIKKIAEEKGFERVSGILFDLGVSSHQFDSGERGFSFQKDAPLDMRMDRALAVTAQDLVNALGKDELTELFLRYGEEQHARKIAQLIVESRKRKQIETTRELADIITRAYPRFTLSRGDGKQKIHPATKIFQALRIAVNDELHSLQEALQQSETLLAPGGKIVVISFHSLEDRVVKQTFLDFAMQRKGVVVTKKPIIPTYEESNQNPRSRSAKLRVFEKA